MSDCFIKELHLSDSAATLSVEGFIPGGATYTLAVVARRGGVVTVAARASGSDASLSTQCGFDALPTTGEVGVSGYGAGADATFAVLAEGDVSAADLLAAVEGRLDNPGPGTVPVGTTLKVLSGARTVRAPGDFHWNSMPPDEVFGHSIESSNLSKLRVVFSRVLKSLPSGLATDVTVSRATYSTVANPDWSQSSGSAYCVAQIHADSLQGLSGDVDLEWTRLGSTYYGSTGVTAYNPGGSGTNVHYVSPLNLDSTADWSSGVLTVTDPA